MERAVPGTDLSGDPGHEGSGQPMNSLKGGSAAANTQPLLGGPNTGIVRGDLANATDATNAPFAGSPGGSVTTYSPTPQTT